MQNVDRRNANVECGVIVGHLNIKLKETGALEFIAIPCTKPMLHRDACAFEGQSLVILRRQL